MCEFEQPCPEGESSRVRVDQLRRLVWMLMVWVSLLTLGLSAVVTLHFVKPFISNKVAFNKPSSPAGAGYNLTTYNYYVTADNNKTKEDTLELQWKKNSGSAIKVKVDQDGGYFIYLQVTLLSENPGNNYTVSVKLVNSTKSLIEKHIHESEMSTGFMGKGFRLSGKTEIIVICSPWTKIDPDHTYLGIIKL